MVTSGRTIGLVLVMLAASVPSSRADDASDRRRAEFFESRIRPVLVQHCYECHDSAAKGGLRLDFADGLTTGGDSGSALEAGKPDDSVLIQALRYDGYEMPPAGKLPAAVLADFETWVREGAFDPRDQVPGGELADPPGALQPPLAEVPHWAFQPPTRHQPPAVQARDWPRGQIDRFILAKLEEQHLQPASDADRAKLLRRVSFDLTGLPPTPEEIAAFQADPRPDALAVRVDALLASPRFGETWGRHWLDVARYADTNGGDFNATLFDAWRYRDYVIAALNEDRPFDQFVREQIAGDLLPAADDAQRTQQTVATGFLALGAKMLSERDKKKLQLDIVDEQLDSIGKAFLGLTLGCARCHDHKFDPIPARDYYALAGIFTSTVTVEGEIQQYVSNVVTRDVPATPAEATALAAHDAAVKQLILHRAVATKAATAAQDALKELQGDSRVVVDDAAAVFTGDWKASTYTPGFVGVGYRHDDNAGKGEKSVTFATPLPAGRYEVQLAYVTGGTRASQVPVTVRHAEGTAELSVNQQVPGPIEQRYVSLGVFPFGEEAATVTLSNAGTQGHVIADAVRFLPVETTNTETPPEVLAAAQTAVEDTKAAVAAAENSLKTLLKAAPRKPQALGVKDSELIADCRLRIRGEPARLGEAVPRGFLSCCGEKSAPLSRTQSGRVELARWITRPEHPLTARVYVNRVWMHLFGEGIVRSVDHFGTMGEAPSHPELLDDLAVRFAADGWSTKRLIRELVLSRTYGQAAAISDEGLRKSESIQANRQSADPENRLLWRMNRKPLTAEELRDALLVLSERLDGGRTVAPVADFGVLAVDNNVRKPDDHIEAGTFALRSVYLPLVRNDLPPVLTIFDFADPEAVVGKRDETNVPAQALFLLNSPFVRQAAQATAQRVSQLSADDGAGIEAVYQQALGRPPNAVEVERAREFLRSGAREDCWPLLVQAIFASTEFRNLE